MSKYMLGKHVQKVEGVIKPGPRTAAWYLTEAGLYKYLLQAKGAPAEEFQDYVYQLLKEERKRTVDATQFELKIAQAQIANLQQAKTMLGLQHANACRTANEARARITELQKENAQFKKKQHAAEDAAFLRRMGRSHLIEDSD